jgi:hypothetical protein
MTTDQMRKLGYDSMSAALSSLGAWTNNMQAITAEITDYAKTSLEGWGAALEKLAGAKSFDKAVEVQGEYLSSAYGDFVAKATKLGELYVALAQEAHKPFASVFAKASTAE